MEADDTAYVATPPKIKNSVLLITNCGEDTLAYPSCKERTSNLENALKAAKDIDVDVVKPPVLTINTQGQKIDPYKHDVIIVYQINNINKPAGIVPGTFQDIKN